MPLLAWLVVVGAIMLPGTFLFSLAAIGLVGSVHAAVQHAEVVAHCVGEPFGTLVLAVEVSYTESIAVAVVPIKT